MSQIFLTYAKEDKAQIDEIYVALKKAELDPWMDEPPRPYNTEGLQPGLNWDDEIRKKIREASLAKALVFVRERNWQRSQIACLPMRHGIRLIRIAS